MPLDQRRRRTNMDLVALHKIPQNAPGGTPGRMHSFSRSPPPFPKRSRFVLSGGVSARKSLVVREACPDDAVWGGHTNGLARLYRRAPPFSALGFLFLCETCGRALRRFFGPGETQRRQKEEEFHERNEKQWPAKVGKTSGGEPFGVWVSVFNTVWREVFFHIPPNIAPRRDKEPSPPHRRLGRKVPGCAMPRRVGLMPLLFPSGVGGVVSGEGAVRPRAHLHTNAKAPLHPHRPASMRQMCGVHF